MRSLILFLFALSCIVSSSSSFVSVRKFRNIQQGEQTCSGTCTCTPLSESCTQDGDCMYDEICINGECVPLPSPVTECDINCLNDATGGVCNSTFDSPTTSCEIQSCADNPLQPCCASVSPSVRSNRTCCGEQILPFPLPFNLECNATEHVPGVFCDLECFIINDDVNSTCSSMVAQDTCTLITCEDDPNQSCCASYQCSGSPSATVCCNGAPFCLNEPPGLGGCTIEPFEPPPPPVCEGCQNAGFASAFAVLSNVYINNGEATTITGDVGYTAPPAVIPTIDGSTFTPPSLTYILAGSSQQELLDSLLSQPCNTTIVGSTTFNGQTITPGVYCIGMNLLIDSSGLILEGSGTFIFRVGGNITTVPTSQVTLSSNASFCDVFWVSTMGVTLGESSSFIGTIISDSGITLEADVSLLGRVLGFNGIVTTIDSTITAPCNSTPSPSPSPSPSSSPSPSPSPSPDLAYCRVTCSNGGTGGATCSIDFVSTNATCFADCTVTPTEAFCVTPNGVCIPGQPVTPPPPPPFCDVIQIPCPSDSVCPEGYLCIDGICTIQTPTPSPSPSPSPSSSPIPPSISPSPPVETCDYPYPVTCHIDCGAPQTYCCVGITYCNFAQACHGVGGCVPQENSVQKEGSIFSYLSSLLFGASDDDDNDDGDIPITIPSIIPHPVLQKKTYSSTPTTTTKSKTRNRHTFIGVEFSKYIEEQLLLQNAISDELECTCEFNCSIPEVCECDTLNATSLIVSEISCTGGSIDVECPLNTNGISNQGTISTDNTVSTSLSSTVSDITTLTVCENGVGSLTVDCPFSLDHPLSVTEIDCTQDAINISCPLNTQDIIITPGSTLDLHDVNVTGLEPSSIVDALCSVGEIGCNLTIDGTLSTTELSTQIISCGEEGGHINVLCPLHTNGIINTGDIQTDTLHATLVQTAEVDADIAKLCPNPGGFVTFGCPVTLQDGSSVDGNFTVEDTLTVNEIGCTGNEILFGCPAVFENITVLPGGNIVVTNATFTGLDLDVVDELCDASTIDCPLIISNTVSASEFNSVQFICSDSSINLCNTVGFTIHPFTSVFNESALNTLFTQTYGSYYVSNDTVEVSFGGFISTDSELFLLSLLSEMNFGLPLSSSVLTPTCTGYIRGLGVDINVQDPLDILSLNYTFTTDIVLSGHTNGGTGTISPQLTTGIGIGLNLGPLLNPILNLIINAINPIINVLSTVCGILPICSTIPSPIDPNPIPSVSVGADIGLLELSVGAQLPMSVTCKYQTA